MSAWVARVGSPLEVDTKDSAGDLRLIKEGRRLAAEESDIIGLRTNLATDWLPAGRFEMEDDGSRDLSRLSINISALRVMSEGDVVECKALSAAEDRADSEDE